jgi:putative peptidoglycan lipid II flippase
MSLVVETPVRISERKVLQGGLVVGMGLLAGQALGFVRQATIAYFLGTGPQADAIAVAFAPVDLWWAVLATTLIFGFGPMLAARQHSSFEDLLRAVLPVALLSTGVFVVLAPQIVRLLAPGLPDETAASAAGLLRITALAIPAVAWSTVFTALMYSERRFAFPAFHQGTVNLCIIVTAVLFEFFHHSGSGFAVGYAAGAWLQLAGAHWIARRSVESRPPAPRRVDWSKLLSGPAPVLCYATLIGLNPVVTRALASTFGPGATAAFDYCLKLVGVPLALLVIPLSSSLLSEIAAFRVREDRRAALAAIARAAWATALGASAIVLLMMAAGPWLVALLFERGRFGASSTSAVTAILTGYFPVLIAWSVVDVISRSLFALGRAKAPIAAAAVALATNVVVSVAAPLGSIHWIGVGAVVGQMLAAAVITASLRRREPV